MERLQYLLIIQILETILSRVLFDMGAATGQIQLDNVSLYESLINDGTFEDNSTLWTGNARNIIDNGSNLINFANV